MKRDKTEKMQPLKGLLIAVAAMWGLASLGVFILIRSHHWWFFGDETTTTLLSMQILAFYVAYFGAKLPSVVIAGFIIAHTDVRRPYVTTFVIVFAFQIVMFGITLLRWPWSAMPALPISVPITGEIVNVLLLTASAALGVLWHNLWNRVFPGKKRDNNQIQDICA